MKSIIKRLVPGLAISGLVWASSAAAASNVTLYGVVDINMEVYNNSPGGTVTGLRSNGLGASRWGLRGAEDFGDGLKAVFQLESGFGLRNGQSDGRMFQRTAMVGLAGPWGELTFGRQYTSSHVLSVPYAPLGMSPMYDVSGRYKPVRADNAVRYRGKFGAFEASAYYAFRDQIDQAEGDGSVLGSAGAAMQYDFGVIRMVGAFDHINAPTLSTTTGDTENFLIGVRADIGAMKISSIYRYRRVEQLLDDNIKSHLYTLGLGYQISPSTLVEAGYLREKFINAPDGYLGTTSDTWQQFMLRGTYSLSKRTKLYTLVAHSRDGALNLGSHNDVGGAPYVLAADKDNQTGGAIGIQHVF